MSAANYALCDSCDGKVFYVGDADIPLGTVVTHVECQLRELAKVRANTWREAIEALRDDERYRNWWSRLGPEDPEHRYWDFGRKQLADFLESLAPKETP